MKKIGIVGSRRRSSLYDRQLVTDIILSAIKRYGKENIEIVSGGCRRGADKFAKDTALLYGLLYKEFPIRDDPPAKHKREFTERAYARNRQIAEYSDVLFALVTDDRTGGSESTIRYAEEFGRQVFCVDDDGLAYLSTDGKETDKT